MRTSNALDVSLYIYLGHTSEPGVLTLETLVNGICRGSKMITQSSDLLYHFGHEILHAQSR